MVGQTLDALAVRLTIVLGWILDSLTQRQQVCRYGRGSVLGANCMRVLPR